MSDLVTVQRPSDRSEWLRLRHSSANASDAAVYMGCHPFKSLADLAVEKLAEDPPDVSSRAMERGNRLEAAIADWWADEHGLAIYEPAVMYAAGRFLATLDRRIVGNDREALEVKSTNKRIDEPEPYWFWQVQAQMLCADLDRVHIAALDGSMDLKSFVIDRDNAAIADLVERANKFWDHLDLGMVPPEAEFTADHITRIHPVHTPESFVDLDDDGFQLIVEWEQARQARLAAEDVEKQLKDAVARLIAENEGARYDGRPVCSWKANKPSLKTDYKALEADHPEIVQQYRREVPGPRVLRFVKDAAA